MIRQVPATALYAALLTGLFLVLSIRVIGRRRSGHVAIGYGGNPALERAARVHANFAEYAPLGLLLLLLVESCGYPRWLVHAAGIALVLGRLVHAWGVSRADEDFRLRATGMAFTLTTLGVLSLLLLGASVSPAP